MTGKLQFFYCVQDFTNMFAINNVFVKEIVLINVYDRTQFKFSVGLTKISIYKRVRLLVVTS